MLEDVVSVELGDRGDLHSLNVPSALIEDRVGRRKAQKNRAVVESAVEGLRLRLSDGHGCFRLGQVGASDRLQGLNDDFGLRSFTNGQAVDDDRLVVLKL